MLLRLLWLLWLWRRLLVALVIISFGARLIYRLITIAIVPTGALLITLVAIITLIYRRSYNRLLNRCRSRLIIIIITPLTLITIIALVTVIAITCRLGYNRLLSRLLNRWSTITTITTRALLVTVVTIIALVIVISITLIAGLSYNRLLAGCGSRRRIGITANRTLLVTLVSVVTIIVTLVGAGPALPVTLYSAWRRP